MANTCQCQSESVNPSSSFVSTIRPLPAQPRGQRTSNILYSSCIASVLRLGTCARFDLGAVPIVTDVLATRLEGNNLNRMSRRAGKVSSILLPLRIQRKDMSDSRTHTQDSGLFSLSHRVSIPSEGMSSVNGDHHTSL